MQTRLDPPIEQWPSPTADRPVWTGHQLTLFHPGIVAKYLAAEAVSNAARARAVPYRNVVVDQDVYDPLAITLPGRSARHRDRLVTQVFSLGRVHADIPVGMQPPAAFNEIESRLAQLPVDAGLDVDSLRAALADTQEQPTLAAQMDRAVRRLLPSFASGAPSTFASAMLVREAVWVDRLRQDASRCAALYNDAVGRFPGSGMSRMSIEPDRVEVPLWALEWMKPRRRVYVDIADSSPMLITEDGEPLDNAATLAPRALLMTALLRRPDRCRLFIHGAGGWSYDRITERWWKNWQGETLAPMALATADVFLDFDDVPHGPPNVLTHALWRAHHLPHNLDRELNLASPLTAEKRELLTRMDYDRDKKRRRSAFRRIHEINRDLATQYPKAITKAQRAVEQARLGVANAAIASKRDWSFLLYPPQKLEALREQIASPLRDTKSP